MGRVILILLAAMISACSKGGQQAMTVTVPSQDEMQATVGLHAQEAVQGRESKSELQAMGGGAPAFKVPTWGVDSPQSSADVNCFAVAILQAGSLTCTNASGGTAIKADQLIGGIAPGGTVTATVSPGQVTVYIIGFASTSCGSFAGGLPKSRLSAPFVMGSSTATVASGTTSLTVHANLTNATQLAGCNGAWSSAVSAPHSVSGATDSFTTKDLNRWNFLNFASYGSAITFGRSYLSAADGLTHTGGVVNEATVTAVRPMMQSNVALIGGTTGNGCAHTFDVTLNDPSAYGAGLEYVLDFSSVSGLEGQGTYLDVQVFTDPASGNQMLNVNHYELGTLQPDSTQTLLVGIGQFTVKTNFGSGFISISVAQNGGGQQTVYTVNDAQYPSTYLFDRQHVRPYFIFMQPNTPMPVSVILNDASWTVPGCNLEPL